MAFPKRLTEKTLRGRVELPRPEPDVFDLVPPTDDITHLEHVWRLDTESAAVTRLLMWRPTNEVDQNLRDYLLAFAREVIVTDRKLREVSHTRTTKRRTTR